MTQIKPFNLKLFYFGAAILPLLLFAFVPKHGFNETQNGFHRNLLFTGIISVSITFASMAQNRLREMGMLSVKMSWVHVACFTAAGIFILLLRLTL